MADWLGLTFSLCARDSTNGRGPANKAFKSFTMRDEGASHTTRCFFFGNTALEVRCCRIGDLEQSSDRSRRGTAIPYGRAWSSNAGRWGTRAPGPPPVALVHELERIGSPRISPGSSRVHTGIAIKAKRIVTLSDPIGRRPHRFPRCTCRVAGAAWQWQPRVAGPGPGPVGLGLPVRYRQQARVSPAAGG
jgi:hypothetical protein